MAWTIPELLWLADWKTRMSRYIDVPIKILKRSKTSDCRFVCFQILKDYASLNSIWIVQFILMHTVQLIIHLKGRWWLIRNVSAVDWTLSSAVLLSRSEERCLNWMHLNIRFALNYSCPWQVPLNAWPRIICRLGWEKYQSRKRKSLWIKLYRSWRGIRGLHLMLRTSFKSTCTN